MLACVGLALACFWLASSADAQSIPNRYDDKIEEAVRLWWVPGTDWRWWKAQLYAESRLDPNAVSPAGARGVAQFMPDTWAEMAGHLGYGPSVSPVVAEAAIDAGAYYMARLHRQWSAPRPVIDRWDLARASYNAGLGHLLTAQRLCGGAAPYAQIIACLHLVTGENSRETITYVDRIHRLYLRLLGS